MSQNVNQSNVCRENFTWTVKLPLANLTSALSLQRRGDSFFEFLNDPQQRGNSDHHPDDHAGYRKPGNGVIEFFI